MKNNDKTVAIVTGGSRGIGRETAIALLNRGCTVYEFSRSGEDFDGVKHISVDVTDEECVKAAVSKIYDIEGQIDILINNAGFGISGAIEFTSVEDAKRQFDVNFFGQFIVAKAVIPYMREKQKGTIVNISSVAAVAPIPFQAFYSASKSAISTLTACLANELLPFGINVRAILPGDIKTGFTEKRIKTFEGDDVYGGKISTAVVHMEKDEQSGMSAAAAGKYVASVALRKHGRIYYTIRFDYKLLAFLAKSLPAKFVNFLLRMIYFH